VKNPYASPDPHQKALALVGAYANAGVQVLSHSHVINGTEQRLSITTTVRTSRFTWNAKRGDWELATSEVSA